MLVMGLALAGCASIEPKPGFDRVSGMVEERTGNQIHWGQGGAEDEQVRARVQAMVADGLDADEAVQVALLANPRLQAVYEELGIAQADLVQAGLLSNPVFGAVVLRPRDEDHTNLDFDIAWNFLSVFTMPLRKQAAAENFEAVKKRLVAAGLEPLSADIVMRPENRVAVSGETEETLRDLIDWLDELDDVQEVYHNAALQD